MKPIPTIQKLDIFFTILVTKALQTQPTDIYGTMHGKMQLGPLRFCRNIMASLHKDIRK
jgi:hypothetical protein